MKIETKVVVVYLVLFLRSIELQQGTTFSRSKYNCIEEKFVENTLMLFGNTILVLCTMYCLLQRLKSTFFEFFSSGGDADWRQIFKNVDFSGGNRATT